MRLAKVKYVRNQKISNVAESLELMFKNGLQAHLDSIINE